MRFTTVFLILAVLTLSGGAQQRPSTSAATGPGRTSVTLFDNLKDGEDYIYLLSNSSFVAQREFLRTRMAAADVLLLRGSRVARRRDAARRFAPGAAPPRSIDRGALP